MAAHAHNDKHCSSPRYLFSVNIPAVEHHCQSRKMHMTLNPGCLSPPRPFLKSSQCGSIALLEAGDGPRYAKLPTVTCSRKLPQQLSTPTSVMTYAPCAGAISFLVAACSRFQTSRTALMHPSFSGLFVTWAYLPQTTLPPGVTSPSSLTLTCSTRCLLTENTFPSKSLHLSLRGGRM